MYNDTDRLLERDIIVFIAMVSGGVVGWYEIIKFIIGV